MLGDLLGELQGNVTVQRVLPGEHGLAPTMESSFQATGALLGTPVADTGTYEARLRADGTLQGTGQGITMSASGDSVTWQGSGVGRFNQDGSISWRGSIIFTSDSAAFAELRGLIGVFEWETAQDGKATGKIWAWK
ncbi:hypothetical protein ACIA8O_39125 [Kitasatospora sp. NPDC051853]|uniref:hypothetical protein n=1 Tax=Kitasatospora sp. NPDC051853 TaxID=3364058 RepID=UPI0037B99197